MTPVEELREAAKVLRSRAEAATAGPWLVNHDDMWSVVFSEAPGIEWSHQREITTTHTPDDVWPNNVYIATMDPLVGLALADLLEIVADGWAGPAYIERYAARWRIQDRALAVARAILGGGEPT